MKTHEKSESGKKIGFDRHKSDRPPAAEIDVGKVKHVTHE